MLVKNIRSTSFGFLLLVIAAFSQIPSIELTDLQTGGRKNPMEIEYEDDSNWIDVELVEPSSPLQVS